MVVIVSAVLMVGDPADIMKLQFALTVGMVAVNDVVGVGAEIVTRVPIPRAN